MKVRLEYAVIAISVVAVIAYYRRYTKTKDAFLVWFMAAVLVSIFSELAFTLYRSAYDTYNLLGHVYKLIAFVLIYRGVFIPAASESFVRLKQSEGKFETAFFSSPTLMVITTVETDKVVEINDAFCNFFGYSRNRFIGKPFKELKTGAAATRRDAIMRMLDKIGAARNIEVELHTKSGPRTVMASFGYIYINNRKHLLSVAVDVTEREKAVRDLRESKRQLQKTNRTLKTLSGCNQVMIHATDVETLLQKTCDLLVSVGGYHIAWMGYMEHDQEKTVRAVAKAGDNVGQYIASAQVSWADTAKDQGPYGKAVRSGKPVLVPNVASDPSLRRWRELAAKFGIASTATFPLFVNGKVIGALCVYAEVPEAFDSEVVSLLTELAADLSYGIQSITTAQLQKEDQKHVKELSDLRAKFIHIISHQLRTPLSSVRWNLESLLSGDIGRLTDTQRQFINLTHEANINVISRIDDLLQIIAIEENQVVYDKSSVSVECLLKSVIDVLDRRCREKSLKCSYALPQRPLPTLQVDPQKVRLVFTKLIENAILYTPKKGKIAIALKTVGKKIRFEVSDTGIGIPIAERPHVGTAFFRASNAFLVEPDASGVGLAIARCFIEQQGGTMGFTSNEGKGSTFWFEMPVG